MIYEPLLVEARLDPLNSEVCLEDGQIALDGLLAYAVSVRDRLPPLDFSLDRRPDAIEIPVMREPGGRFHLASFGVYAWARQGIHYTNQRFPEAEAGTFGDPRTVKRIDVGSGQTKSVRIPRMTGHLVDDLIRFWCVGDVSEIRRLLGFVLHVGKKGAVGLGGVDRWIVEPCEPWGPGFPVLLPDGMPTRSLPPDYPGLSVDAGRAFRTMTYPYHSPHVPKTECAVPSWL